MQFVKIAYYKIKELLQKVKINQVGKYSIFRKCHFLKSPGESDKEVVPGFEELKKVQSRIFLRNYG